jgi:hypothetical protein
LSTISLFVVDLVFIPKYVEEMGRVLSSQTWLPVDFSGANLLPFEASGSNAIDELGDHDINLDTACQIDLLDNAAADENKCMFTELLAC